MCICTRSDMHCRREADKRRLLKHRRERLSYDPRMPARLAAFPCHMACTLAPPYALLDPAAPIATTALNMDGDGWSPMVDVVRLNCPSPASSTGGQACFVIAKNSCCASTGSTGCYLYRFPQLWYGELIVCTLSWSWQMTAAAMLCTGLAVSCCCSTSPGHMLCVVWLSLSCDRAASLCRWDLQSLSQLPATTELPCLHQEWYTGVVTSLMCARAASVGVVCWEK